MKKAILFPLAVLLLWSVAISQARISYKPGSEIKYTYSYKKSPLSYTASINRFTDDEVNFSYSYSHDNKLWTGKVELDDGAIVDGTYINFYLMQGEYEFTNSSMFWLSRDKFTKLISEGTVDLNWQTTKMTFTIVKKEMLDQKTLNMLSNQVNINGALTPVDVQYISVDNNQGWACVLNDPKNPLILRFIYGDHDFRIDNIQADITR